MKPCMKGPRCKILLLCNSFSQKQEKLVPNKILVYKAQLAVTCFIIFVIVLYLHNCNSSRDDTNRKGQISSQKELVVSIFRTVYPLLDS